MLLGLRITLDCIIVISTLVVSLLFPEQNSHSTTRAVPLPNGRLELPQLFPRELPAAVLHLWATIGFSAA